MSLHIKKALIIFLFCSFFSCNHKIKRDVLLEVIEEKETVFQSGQLVIKEEMGQFYDMHITDSVVFFTSSRGDHAIKAYATENFKLIDEFGYKDQGPEGVDYPFFLKSLSDIDNELYDLNTKSFIEISFIPDNNKYQIKKKLIEESLWPCYNLNNVSDSIYFANGLAPFNEGLYFRWDKRSPVKKWIPFYPEYKKTKENEDINFIYRNTILTNKEKSLVICAMKYFNRILVFDFNGKMLKDIQVGVNKKEPVIENAELEKFSNNTEMYFLNMIGSDKYFYCLWNRNRMNNNKEKKMNSKIFVFDWNLNHIETIQTDQVLSAIGVDPDDTYILGLVFDEEEDTSVYKYNIQLL
jgi:hypothetical protein